MKGSGGSERGAGTALERPVAISSRDRTVGAVFVLIVLVGQTLWMGRAIIFLSCGLLVAYVVWAAARWKQDALAVLPVYLMAVAIQGLHFTEEYVTGFQHQFPALFRSDWSDACFVSFNILWLSAFALAGLGIHRRVPLAYLGAFFLGLVGGVGNGLSHLVLAAIYGRYFPGVITAPLCLLVGVMLLVRLFSGTPRLSA